MTKAFEKIARGLTEAIEFAQGKPTGARVHQVRVPSVDVAADCPGIARTAKETG